MKKLSALILALALLVSVIPVAYAANATPNTTTLTTTVPSATYVLNIPADQTVTFGATSTYIGNVTITDSKNFAEGKNVDVTVEYIPFTAEAAEISTTIPYSLVQTSITSSTAASDAYTANIASGGKMTFKGKSDGKVKELTEFTATSGTLAGVNKTYSMKNLIVKINSTDWGKALAGNYKSTITFTSEIVVA